MNCDRCKAPGPCICQSAPETSPPSPAPAEGEGMSYEGMIWRGGRWVRFRSVEDLGLYVADLGLFVRQEAERASPPKPCRHETLMLDTIDDIREILNRIEVRVQGGDVANEFETCAHLLCAMNEVARAESRATEI